MLAMWSGNPTSASNLQREQPYDGRSEAGGVRMDLESLQRELHSGAATMVPPALCPPGLSPKVSIPQNTHISLLTPSTI